MILLKNTAKFTVVFCFIGLNMFLAARATDVHVTSYRVRGWEHDLVQGTPNLANYYWEPMLRRVINTTRATSRQAKHIPTVIPEERRSFRKRSSRTNTAANLTGRLVNSSVMGQIAHHGCDQLGGSSVVGQVARTYNESSGASNARRTIATSASLLNKQIVYGELRSPVALKARSESLSMRSN